MSISIARGHTLGLLALVLSVTATLLGCSSEESGQDRPKRAAWPYPATVNFTLPFDHYRLTAAEQQTIDAATIELIRQCMNRQGYGWDMPPRPDTGPSIAALDGNSRRYGLAELENARQYGYHLPEEADTQAFEIHANWLESLSPVEDEALFGQGGCSEQATATLLEGVQDLEYDPWFTKLDFDAVEKSAEDASVQQAFAEWSRCMDSRGFDYQTPQEAVEDQRWNLDSPEISADEVAVAVADVQCKHRASIITIRADAESRIHESAIAENAEKFANLKRSNQRYLENAKAVIAE